MAHEIFKLDKFISAWNENENIQFPLEILNMILDNITDISTLSNMRKACTYFNTYLTTKTNTLSCFDKTGQTGQLNINFLNSFQNINKISIDIPISIWYEKDLEILNNYKYDTIFLGLYIDIWKFYTYLRKNQNCLDRTIKIICYEKKNIENSQNSQNIEDNSTGTIRWLKKEYYGVYGTKTKKFKDIDYALFGLTRPKTVITNYKIYKHFTCLPLLENYIYLSDINSLSPGDYIPPYFAKNFTWKPILESQTLPKIHMYNRLYNYSKYSLGYQGVRPKILSYNIPILEKDLSTIEKIYFNCKNFILMSDSLFFEYDKTTQTLTDITTKFTNLLEGREIINDFFGTI